MGPGRMWEGEEKEELAASLGPRSHKEDGYTNSGEVSLLHVVQSNGKR